MAETPAPKHPLVAIGIDGDGDITLNGEAVQPAPEGIDARQHAVHEVARQVAEPLRRAVRVIATDPHSKTTMVVWPDGHSSDVLQLPADGEEAHAATQRDTAQNPGQSHTREAADEAELDVRDFEAMFGGDLNDQHHDADTPQAEQSEPTDHGTESNPFGGSPLPVATADPAPAVTSQAAPVSTSPRHRADPTTRSFLSRNEEREAAPTGWHAFLATFGIRTGPSAAAIAHKADERAVSRNWPGPRTIAVVNGKGGSNKSPSTIILSALFARYGGSGVLAWDNNNTRGTLGWRTEAGPHESHILELLPRTDALMRPDARAADLASFVHHQVVDKFDVLRSNPHMLADEQRLTAADFDAIHQVASKYFRIIVIDSGNDETQPHYLQMIHRCDQLVLATTTRHEHAEAGRLLLDALRDRNEHARGLADNAVVIVSQADREEEAADAIAKGYEGLARQAITIPYDPAMRAPWLRYDNLRPATRSAYLHAAAAVADGL